MAYRLLRDDIAARMAPAETQALDELLVADAEAYIRHVAADLAVHHAAQAARLLLAYQAVAETRWPSSKPGTRW